MAENVFKFAALKKIQSIDNAVDKIALSIKHQVLCDATAMVGVLKQENMSTLLSKEVVIDFTDIVASLP